MEQKHTPEPWESVTDSLTGTYIRRADGLILAKVRELHGFINHEANAARIVACVNACVGMADPAAEIEALRRSVLSYKRLLEDLPVSMQDDEGNWYWIPANRVEDFLRDCETVAGIEYLDNPYSFDEFSSNWGVYATGGDAKNVPYFYR